MDIYNIKTIEENFISQVFVSVAICDTIGGVVNKANYLKQFKGKIHFVNFIIWWLYYNVDNLKDFCDDRFFPSNIYIYIFLYIPIYRFLCSCMNT